MRNSSKTLMRPAALVRYISAQQSRKLVFGNGVPAMGVLALIVAFGVFIGSTLRCIRTGLKAVWTLAQRPYYRSKWSVGSPPLAIRSGMFALGCFPFILSVPLRL